MEATLWKSVERLAPLAPRFVSVTYGADGSTRERTHDVVTRIQRETALTGAPHLTCIGAARGEILDIARGYWDQGIRHLVALRGDPPQGSATYAPHADGFTYAADLVAGLTTRRAVRHLGRRLSGGASGGGLGAGRPGESEAQDRRRRDPRDHAVLLRHRGPSCAFAIAAPPPGSRADRAGDPADHALPAGAALCRALRRVHSRLAARALPRPRGRCGDAPPDCRERGDRAGAVAGRHGVGEFHFYTLNRAELTYAICHALGLRPRPTVRRAPPEELHA